jgi:hypothetical protein
MQIIYMLKKLFQYKIWDIINLATIFLFVFNPQDLPKHEKKNSSQIDYIPDFVLEQLFEHINDLHLKAIQTTGIKSLCKSFICSKSCSNTKSGI